jgi:hypothetical protein
MVAKLNWREIHAKVEYPVGPSRTLKCKRGGLEFELVRSGRSALAHRMADETKTIKLWPCRYSATCKVQNCRARATMIARASDSGGRPINQYELCSIHADQVVQREQLKELR